MAAGAKIEIVDTGDSCDDDDSTRNYCSMM